jgi:hypothetical protein
MAEINDGENITVEFNKQNLQKVITSDFAKSVYNISLDSMMLAFALVIAMMFYTAIKGTINYFFKFDKQNILMKYIFAIILTIIFVGMSSFLKYKFNYNTPHKINYAVTGAL